MRKITLFFALIFSGLIALGYWGWNKTQGVGQDNLALRLSLDDKIDSLDPAKSFSDDSLLLSAQILEPLYQYHYLKRPYEIEPLVADGLPQITEDGTHFRIKLKKNVYYHAHPSFSGKRELIAEDFVNQFKRLALRDLKSPGRGLFLGLIRGFDGYSQKINHKWERILSEPLEGVTAEDRYTFSIRLNKSEPNMIYYLALNFLSPVPWELIKFRANNLDQDCVGTGPYLLKRTDGEYYDLERNTSYREDFYPTSGDRYANVERLLDSSKQKIPFIEKVRFYVTGSEAERWERFFKKQIDLLTVPKSFLPRLYDQKGELAPELRSGGVLLKHFPNLSNRWLAFNMRDPLVGKNENLRRAIAYAIDYSKYIQVLSQNTNLRANSILVPGIAGYMPTKEFRFNFDPVLAKEYLKKAGFTNPSTMPEIVYSTRANQASNLLEAEFIKAHLEAIGLKVKIQVLTFREFLEKGRAGELMFFTDNWLFDYPDGENILQLLVSGNFPGVNKSGYSNKKIDELYEKLKETSNVEKRNSIIQEMEEIVFIDLPWIPMMYESSFVLQVPELKNFRKSSIIRNYVKYLKIEK